MVSSIKHLVSYAWANLVAALGTTTLSILLFPFAIPIVVFAATVAVSWRDERRTGKSAMEIVRGSILSWQTIIPSVIYLVAWIGLLSWSLTNTTYKDHMALLGRIRALVSQNKALQSTNGTLSKENQQLQSMPPKTITHTLPAPEPEKKCWLQDHFGMPNSTIQGAKTATAAIIHCNYKIEAPYALQVRFDRDFIPGALVVLDSGVMMGGEGKEGRIFVGRVNSPALLSDQLIIVTVYGETDQYPRSLEWGIKTLN